MLKNLERHLGAIDQLITALEEELVPLVKRLAEITGSREDDLGEAVRKARESFHGNRKVVLAVVGQVKTGKSTLLNSILFEGRPLLPTAATPKTARLTIVREAAEGEIPGVDIHFYDSSDWQEIRNRAQEESKKPNLERVYADTVAGAERKLGPEIPQLLGTCRTVALAELEDYVAADGRFADLVKYTVLRFPQMPFPDLMVVDTPGLNDPVRAREQETLKHLRDADAVVFLSSPHRFLDREDMELVLGYMVRAGIQEVLVVVPQMDNLTPKQKDEFLTISIPNMSQRAANFAHEAGFGPLAQELASRIFVPENTILVSAMADVLAKRMERHERLSEEERWTLDSVMRKHGWPVEDPVQLRKASNIEALVRRIESRVVARKRQILLSGPLQKVQARVNDLAAQNERRLAETQEDLEKLQEGLEERRREKEAELREFEQFNAEVEMRIERFKRRVLTDFDWTVTRLSRPQVVVTPWFRRSGEEAALAEEIALEAQKELRKKAHEVGRRYEEILPDLQESIQELVPSLESQAALAREVTQLVGSIFRSLDSLLERTRIKVTVKFTYSFWDKLFGKAPHIAEQDVARACRRAEHQVANALRDMQQKCDNTLLEELDRLKARFQSLRSDKQRKLDELERGIIEGKAACERLRKKYEQQLKLFQELKRVLDKIEPWFAEIDRAMGREAA